MTRPKNAFKLPLNQENVVFINDADGSYNSTEEVFPQREGGKVKVYAAGGCGTNIGYLIFNSLEKRPDVYFIDTSDANIRNKKEISRESLYIVEGMDGAGKYRKDALEGFKDLPEEVLIKFKPSDTLNVVVSSLSGGSGSVIAPLITKELLKRDHNVIVIGIGSKSSDIEVRNTINTLKSYKLISEQLNKPVVMFYLENNKDRVESDSMALWLVKLFNTITDKSLVEEFDKSDLTNFINYNRVTDYPPTVAFLDAVNKNNEYGTKVSSLLITGNKGVVPDMETPYLATCHANLPDMTDILLEVRINLLNIIVDRLNSKVKENKDKVNAFRLKDYSIKSEISDSSSSIIV
ncbi:MAG: hypothetical protein QXF12_07455 [Candidatus Aenigmatarchaeota archaeon]